MIVLQKFGGAGLSSMPLILSTGILALDSDDGAAITNLLTCIKYFTIDFSINSCPHTFSASIFQVF